MKRHKSAMVLLVFVFIASLVVLTIPKLSRLLDEEKKINDNSEDTQTTEISTEETTAAQDMKVYVSGEVNNPGVYEIKNDMRIEDVIELAGGVCENADLESVNLAEHIYDAQQIHIPSKGENTAAASSTGTDSKININTASLEQLQGLSGIGETKAQDIIDYRNSKGNFKKIEDIMNVSGIGSKTFEKFKDKITV